MVTKYSAGITPVTKSESSSTTTVVLLTGSTGGLGSFLLENLLRNGQVSKIYAYNRPSKGGITMQDRQKAAFVDKGFDLKYLDSERLVYVEGDADLPLLGLTSELYEKV